jgi:hypothetical protein
LKVWDHYRAISNELNTPKVLACTSDGAKNKATSFINGQPNWMANSRDFISYFVGTDADETKPQTILSGDRNIQRNNADLPKDQETKFTQNPNTTDVPTAITNGGTG